MIEKTKDCKISSGIVPVCPVCGEKMETNLRKDSFFVQDDNWYKQSEEYDKFLENARDKKLLLLELGVGFNTPGIIRFPFEQMVYQNSNWNLIRVNKDNGNTVFDIKDKSIIIEDDIKKVVEKIA